MRSLSLRKEALAELSAGELASVVGGTTAFLTDACVSQSCSGVMCLFSEAICFES